MNDAGDRDALLIMEVRIHYKRSGSCLHFTCYDAGEGVWRVQDGIGYVHLFPLLPRSDEEGGPQWRKVVRLKDVERVEIRRWDDAPSDDATRPQALPRRRPLHHRRRRRSTSETRSFAIPMPKAGGTTFDALVPVVVRIRLPYQPTGRLFEALEALHRVVQHPMTYDRCEGHYVSLSMTLPKFVDVMARVMPMLNRLNLLDVAEVTVESETWIGRRLVHPVSR